MAVGQMVGMYWKHHFQRARPVQLFPAVMPLILTPPHPSFPNNHSFQSHLIAYTVQAAFEEPVAGAMHAQLMALADRIGNNRVVAGVHFPTDTDAGKFLARAMFPLLAELEFFARSAKPPGPSGRGLASARNTCRHLLQGRTTGAIDGGRKNI